MDAGWCGLVWMNQMVRSILEGCTGVLAESGEIEYWGVDEGGVWWVAGMWWCSSLLGSWVVICGWRFSSLSVG